MANSKLSLNQKLQDTVKYDLIREDGRLERVCEHGIGHPVGHKRGYLLRVDGVHGCDGCCRAYDYNTQEYREI